MKRYIRTLTCFICYATYALFAQAEEKVEKVKWLYSYPQAIEEAKKTGKPIFLEFRWAP